ncbi:hypothetical protein HN51_061139 [Arachis hypogaea]|uniref:PsbQ-like protein 3, chloroplastic n=1 Tax=Arachis hypogaea TaxID=3818 RepID=A0A445AM43_ARAHY|nr:psbQ-like protein 3, chloroplastic [Arachis ipaensis]XP_025626317.1 psbQ-like protein 3, chloroplastic [Arachis hypogaea]QHO18323.1 PsbQ-like protein 3 [Arachis hypogaea]RYR27517.1 hypothetical protein Ahy_B01g051536 [Arachis hypogaea]
MEFMRTFILKPNMTTQLYFPPFTSSCCVNKVNKPYSYQNPNKDDLSLKMSKRVGVFLSVASLILRTQSTSAFEFKFVAPDQTIEEAESGVRGHAQNLLQVKDLLELESWKAAQKELRMSSALLKKDIYTIIQNKPGIERPPLRKLYTTLFNNVTRLDYAARDKDIPEIWRRYENIVVAVNDILSRI